MNRIISQYAKRLLICLSFIICQLSFSSVAAQTMTVKTTQGVTYVFTANSSDMTYSDNGQTLTVQGKAFNTSDITGISIDETAAIENNSVVVSYDGTSANVLVAGNVAPYVTGTVSCAHVSLTQSNTADIDNDEITYILSGSSNDGEFTMTGSYKASVELDGLTLTNPKGAAISIMDGKRINISVKKDTENTLTDGNGSQKAAFYVKGHAEFKGKGTLNVYGNYAHAIKSGDYMSVKNCTINVLSAVKDGLSCNEYFLMESGSITISNVGDDGIQADLDGTTSTGEKDGHDEEDTGNVYIQGGAVNITITAAAAKGIKAAGDMKISAGTLNVFTTGNGAYDSDERDAKGSAALKSDGNMTISGGELTLKSSGTGGKCIKADGTLNISGGNINATSTGSQYRYSNSITASAKAIKSDGALTISGGTITASSKTHEAIESKSTLEISGGIVSAISSSDDAINSSGDFTISGGYVMGYASGNDGLDANGNFYIKGGNVYAIGTRQPEVAIDANSEQQKKLYITGGNLVTIGPLEGGSQLTQTCYQNSSVSANTWYGLYKDGVLVMAIKTPSNTSSLGSGMVVSTGGTTTLKSGITVSGGTTIFDGMGNYDGTASGGSSVSLTSYSAEGGMGPGGGGPGGGGFGPGGGGWRW